MHHLTLNTGHTRVSPREEVQAAAVHDLRRMMADGAHALPTPLQDWTCVTEGDGLGGVLFLVRRGSGTNAKGESTNAALVAVATSTRAADALWPHMLWFHEFASQKAGAPREWLREPIRPQTLPWCATVLLPSTAMIESMAWLGDFERCLAWAWVEKHN